MLKRILVPLDGSPLAEQALPVAARLAQASGGILILLHVVDVAHEAIMYGYSIGGGFVPPGAIDTSVSEGHAYLTHLVLRTHLTGMAAVERQVITGRPAEKILSSAQEQPVDLIVMASHGYSGFKHWLMGSVAEQVAHHASAPVLIVRDGVPLHTYLRDENTTVVRALVPLDPSTGLQDAILPAAELVTAFSTPGQGVLHLIQVIVPPENMRETEKEVMFRMALAHLDITGQHVRETLQAHLAPERQPKVTWSISADNDIAEGIARVAENGEETETAGRVEHCDLIAMTTHSLRGSRRGATGSITDRVLRATRYPLLIVHAAAIEKETDQKIPPTPTRV